MVLKMSQGEPHHVSESNHTDRISWPGRQDPHNQERRHPVGHPFPGDEARLEGPGNWRAPERNHLATLHCVGPPRRLRRLAHQGRPPATRGRLDRVLGRHGNCQCKEDRRRGPGDRHSEVRPAHPPSRSPLREPAKVPRSGALTSADRVSVRRQRNVTWILSKLVSRWVLDG